MRYIYIHQKCLLHFYRLFVIVYSSVSLTVESGIIQSTATTTSAIESGSELQSYDELCNITNVSETHCLPSVDGLQPLSVHLECSNAAFDANDSDTSHLDDVDKIIKVIRKNYDDDGNTDDTRDDYLSNDDDDKDEQEPKRQRFNYSLNAGADATAADQTSSDAANETDANLQSWQPRRRLLRGRRQQGSIQNANSRQNTAATDNIAGTSSTESGNQPGTASNEAPAGKAILI